MDCRFTFKNIDRSDVFIEFAQPKVLGKIEKYATKPIDVHLTFIKQGFEYEAHCTLKGGDGFNIHVDAKGNDLHNALDHMLDKLEIQLRKQKEKIKRHKFPEDETLRHLEVVPEEELNPSWDTSPIDAKDVVDFEKKKKTP